MTKKRYLIGFLSVLLIVLATVFIFFPENNTDQMESLNIDLYFFNNDHSAIVAENRNIKYEDQKELYRIVVDELVKGPSNSKNNPIITGDTELLSVKKKYNNVQVDFSKEYINTEPSKYFLSTYAIVKSLCQLDSVEKVLVTVESNEIVAENGTMIGYLSSDDIDLSSDSTTQDSKNLVLYFADKDNEVLSREKRTIKITDTLPIEQYVVNELIKGTESDRRKNLLSSDTELISCETTDGNCFVNFKSGFVEKNTGTNKNEELILYSIVNSLCETANVGKVQFLIDGKKVEKFGETNISDFFTKNDDIIK